MGNIDFIIGHWTINGIPQCQHPAAFSKLNYTFKDKIKSFHCGCTRPEFEKMSAEFLKDHPDAKVEWIPFKCDAYEKQSSADEMRLIASNGILLEACETALADLEASTEGTIQLRVNKAIYALRAALKKERELK